ncbi:MAG TPA: N-acetyltransferase [Parvularcula sp.]|nr:N-acetyltransferase [Parvularcula sp.]HBS30628.1 N-acetyltransferase [Parvularcula sp.]
MTCLRPLDPDRDGPALYAIFGDDESCRYLARPAFASVAETIAQLKEWGGPDDDTSWAVVDGPEGPALGRVSLFTHGRDIWEAACMIVPAARGRNLAARALAEAIDFVFERKAARRIFADCDPDNIASIRTFEKLGFRREGLLRGTWETHLGVRDSVILGLLRDDPRVWRA